MNGIKELVVRLFNRSGMNPTIDFTPEGIS